MIEVLNARGRVLSYIAHHPWSSVKEVKDGLCLSRRAVTYQMDDLHPLLDAEKVSREYRYNVKSVGLVNSLFVLDNLVGG